ncbi:hypothetical protein JHK87_016375 [Glycine soja]|nr:hypothetical protein JHK87_016375 [Glycine soja]
MHTITSNVAPKELDAMKSMLDGQLSVQAMNQQILRLRFLKLIATNLYAGLYAEVVMAECSTSTKSNEHFTLVSDFAIQINARFIGYRPEGSGRDYTWIQALGILFNSKTLSLEAVKTPQWSENVDHLKFTYNDNPNGV